METFGAVVRLIVVVLGFIAMYGLWTAFDVRREMWTAKLFEIWLSQILLTAAVIEANLELWYRGVFPSAATFFIAFVLLLMIKTTLFNKLPYVRNPLNKGDKPV